jgi:hypothetical protein
MRYRHKAHPYEPLDYDEDIVMAFRQFVLGKANEGQQQTVWKWLQYACGVGEYADLSFRPGGQEGDRLTAFAEGKRFVGLQASKLLHPDVLEAIEREKRGRR